MSFVIATPDLVEGAAQELAGIRSSLAEAATTATAPTTGIAAAAQDEVSVAIASMFGNFGQEFQALSAQAQAFHKQFVSLMNAGAGAYTSAEAANAAQAVLDGGIVGGAGPNLGGAIQTGTQPVSNAIASSPVVLGALQASGAPVLLNGLNTFGATVAAPYQALVSNTFNNLQAIGSTFTANPFPFLHQVVNNQIGYAQTIGASIASGVQNLPAELANLPATIQTGIQGLATFNPGVLLQQLANNQIGYAQTIVTSLQNAGNDLATGLAGLPASFQAAGQALAAGDIVGAGNALGQGFGNVFLPGFQPLSIDISELGSPTAIPLSVTPLGPLGDLAPVFAIPGQMAQNFTNLLPAGSIPAQVAQHVTNVVDTLTNFGSTLNPGNLAITFGLPLQVVFDGIGAPGNALSALNSSAVAFVGAVQTGDPLGAAAALLDTPAVVANGFLNGQTFISLPPVTTTVTVGGIPPLDLTSTAELPLGGLLTPLSPVVLGGGGGAIPGTPIGGFIPGLLSFGSELAAAIAPLM
jgi:PE family